jgi:hypothetical protein
MKIEIITKNLGNDQMVREFIERKVHFALDRINARVGHVVVKLEDASGSSGAFDGICQIDAWMQPSGQIHVSAPGDSAFDAVLQATRKIQQAVKQDIDRNRRSSQIRHQGSKRDYKAALSRDKPRGD